MLKIISSRGFSFLVEKLSYHCDKIRVVDLTLDLLENFIITQRKSKNISTNSKSLLKKIEQWTIKWLCFEKSLHYDKRDFDNYENVNRNLKNSRNCLIKFFAQNAESNEEKSQQKNEILEYLMNFDKQHDITITTTIRPRKIARKLTSEQGVSKPKTLNFKFVS